MKLKTTTYELRDVAIVQAPVSYCEHRGDVNNKVTICKRGVYPVFVSPMASITDEKNYKIWIENGLTPVVPRSVQQNISFNERMQIAKETFVSISLSEAKNEFMRYLEECNYVFDSTLYICIDIAHGTLNSLYNICRLIKDKCGSNVVIMTGNVANPNTYQFYADAGVDYCRVGIGTGCFTPYMCVVTKDGLKKICDIKIGDEVLTHTGEFHEVTHVHEYQKNEKLLRINNIECTSNHLFYVVNKNDEGKITEDNIQEYAYWIQASELDKKKHLLVEK